MFVTVEQHPSAGTVAVKRAAEPEDEDRLRAEAALLRRLRHPGVVELVELREGPGGAELVTVFAGSRTLGQEVPVPTATVATLAATVADLHELGWAHGRIEPTHVVVAADGRPVLCGFAEAVPADRAGATAADVAALGRVLDEAVAAAPTPDRRLAHLAAQATHDDAGRRPSARSLAAALSAAADPPARPRRRRPGARSLAVLAVPAAAVVLAGWVLTRPSPEGVPIELVSPASSTTAPPPAAAVGDRPVVRWAGGRYEVGRPGDEVATGDWDCDGTATVALVRPATGEVFVFDRWAAHGRDLTVRPVTEVPGAGRPAAADPDGDGCDELTVVAGGERITAWPRRAR